MGINKQFKDLIAAAEADGGRVEKKRSGIMIYGPKGMAMIHLSTSDRRSLANARADLRRAGLRV